MRFKYLCLSLLVLLSLHSFSLAEEKTMSSHYKNGVFYNTHQYESKSLWSFIYKRLQHSYAKWPKWIELPATNKQEQQVLSEPVTAGIRVTYINHASFLIQTGGFNIITDPVYSKRVSPFSFIGPKRVHAPAIAFEDLPAIDVVLISHDHYDHLDIKTLTKIIKRDNPKIYTGLKVSKHIPSSNKVVELDWWDKAKVAPNFELYFTEVQHFSGRWLNDTRSTLWGGFVLNIDGKKIYFGGDSGYNNHYKETFNRYGAMDLALLPIGAYEPRNMMHHVHVNPEEAVMAHLDLQAKKSIGMHFGTFQLSAEHINQPKVELETAKQKYNIAADEFITLALGKPKLFA